MYRNAGIGEIYQGANGLQKTGALLMARNIFGRARTG